VAANSAGNRNGAAANNGVGAANTVDSTGDATDGTGADNSIELPRRLYSRAQPSLSEKVRSADFPCDV
jgi:hypothetical protein